MSDPGARPLTVLVLGVGGNVSQGILKALALSPLRPRVIAACISPLSAGLYRADLALVSPRADAPDFLPWLRETCETERVDAVLSGSEPVVDALAAAAAELRAGTGAVCVVSPPGQVEIGRDKLRTVAWQRERGLAHPRTASAADERGLAQLVADCGYPLIAKPRRGRSGAGVVTLEGEAQLGLVAGRGELVVQELIGRPEEEFTVGCFCSAEGRVEGALAMRRELVDGTSYRAEAGRFDQVRDEAVRIAEALGPLGPLNVQLRLREGTAVAFELNVRFSGTTPARARLGFNEVDAALRHLVLGEEVELPEVTEGVVLRYWNELYVPPAARDRLASEGRLAGAEGVTVEDWGMRP